MSRELGFWRCAQNAKIMSNGNNKLFLDIIRHIIKEKRNTSKESVDVIGNVSRLATIPE